MPESFDERLKKIYARAEKESQKKASEYFKKFQAKDKAMHKKLKNGDITPKDYKNWKLSAIQTDKNYKNMVKTIAHEYVKADQTAYAFLNGKVPSVYVASYNGQGKTIEEGVAGYSFELIDQNAVKYLTETNGKLPIANLKEKKAEQYVSRKVRSEVTQALIQGESVDDCAKRLLRGMKNVTKSERVAAKRTSRTLLNGAHNKGRYDASVDAAKDGILLQKQWRATHDARTRDSHAYLDGEIVDLDERFSNGLMFPQDPEGEASEVYNCFVGETRIASDEKIIRSYKSDYKGELFTIKTSAGVSFTCSPNHPILTPRGWIKAKLLNSGEDILVTSGIDNEVSRRNPYINDAFPRMDDFHQSLNKSCSERTRSLSVNFHGDVPASDVEIVTHIGFLRKCLNSVGLKKIYKFLFKLSDKPFAFFSSLAKHFVRIFKSSFSFVGERCKSFALFNRSVCHSDKHSFRTISCNNTVLTEYPIDNLPAETVIRSELLDGLSRKVFVDKIVSIEVCVKSCHLYNLQTKNGYYFVNNSVSHNDEKVTGIFAIAKNCRCRVDTVIKGFRNKYTGKSVMYDDMEAEDYEAESKEYWERVKEEKDGR